MAALPVMSRASSKAALELVGGECIVLMNREENLDLNVSPTLFMEFHGSTALQLT